ncbi:hypothetical protein SpCBS45565_g05131 [Spizellomyces sp. 'palustris']|nr:hypothetical protein SpCBS45565_g05131 [Spizellomyces sp. 'palustris']
MSATTMLMIFAGLVCTGQALFAFGVSSRTFEVMVLGRVIFGAGGESLEVATSRITTDWFKGRGLGFAMSLHLSMARIAAASNDNLSPWLAEHTSTPTAVWFGFIVCLLSSVCAFAMIYLDRPTSRFAAGVVVEMDSSHRKRQKRRLGTEDERQPLLVNDANGTQSRRASVEDGCLGSPLVDRGSLDYDGVSEEEYDEEDETVHFSQLRGLSWSFWMLCLATIGLYGSSVPFFHICTDFFQQKWYPNDSQRAGMVMSIPDLVSAVGSPLCGLFIDRFGHRSTLLPISGVLVLITHAILCWTDITPIIPMSILGIAYSIFASALWTCVPYLVGNHQIATAYGLVAVALNLSLALFPLAVARIRNAHPETFVEVEIFFMVLSFAAIILSLGLYAIDARNGWVLKHHRHAPRSGLGGKPSEGSFSEADGDLEEEAYGSMDEDDLTIKVVGDGVIVPAPHTHIHHHHHHHRSSGPADRRCRCAEDNGRKSPVPSVMDRWPHDAGPQSSKRRMSRSPSRRERNGNGSTIHREELYRRAGRYSGEDDENSGAGDSGDSG